MTRSRSQAAQLLLLLAPAVAAQDFYWLAGSTRAQGMAGIAVPTHGSAMDALGANPALVASLVRPTIDLSLTGGFLNGSFSNQSNSASPLRSAPGAIPAAAIAFPVMPGKLTLAAGATPELLSLSNWSLRDAPGTAGASYGVERHLSRIVAYRLGLLAAWQVTRRLAVGYSGGRVENSNRLNAPYIFQQQPALAGLKVALDLQTSGHGWNHSVGLWAQVSRRFSVGGAWKSPTQIQSTGRAVGDASAQFAALGVSAPSAFTYGARVDNTLPASWQVAGVWTGGRKWLIASQVQSIRWRSAFQNLPVRLSGGTNATINAVAGTPDLFDSVPLHWKDQYRLRVGLERQFQENWAWRAGGGVDTNPVPSSTLTPLTAAILQRHVSGGLSYSWGGCRLDLAYSVAPPAQASVGTSLLRAGEYANSRVRLWGQTVSLGFSFHL